MEILFYLFIATAVIQLFFYLFFFSRLIFYKNKKLTANCQLPISIIICAKNEEANLRKNLPFILEQNYPEYEVIVVNDHSQDETEMTLFELKKKYANLQIVTISSETRWLKGKRFALSLGIKSAKYDWLLLTDADCVSSHIEWIETMQRNFAQPHPSPKEREKNKEIVLGYSPYEKEKTFLNKCIRFDAFFTALQYFSFALAGLPYMGVGRNLAYKKELFYKHKGFSPEQKNLLSGDDDLFINKIATAGNTSIEIDEKSFVYSVPKKTWASWLFQKSRHLSTGIYYKAKHKILLGLLSLSHFLFYAFLFILIFFKINLFLVISIYCFRLLIQWCILYKPIKRLHEPDLWVIYPLMDFLYFFFYLTFAPAVFLNRIRQWK